MMPRLGGEVAQSIERLIDGPVCSPILAGSEVDTSEGYLSCCGSFGQIKRHEVASFGDQSG